ncbi:hypothetical protein MSAN_01943300 [Mycena sanguinolenta]|uniref:(2E,6E)-farnesyl diphosphate synthase n=1 Tax=Mycena sanguinolenta TaxID=230812 RepID=A0A8H6XMT3_9AGAR|nr:hypothetical protein MSAN_01943300 [Mycena sanguinolenta]
MDFVALSPMNIALLVLGLWSVRQVIHLLKTSRAALPFPKIYGLFQPFALPGLLIPTTAWTTGHDWHWRRRFRTYSRDETVHLIPILSGTPGLWTSNMDVGRQILAEHRSSFFKPLWASSPFLPWGMNLAAADGPMWRKHRRVVGPAFGPSLYKLVWEKTAETYRDMVETEGWKCKEAVDIPVVQKITLKLAFLIICSCGFGFPSAWDTPPHAADGRMPVQETLKIVAETRLLPLIVPKWLMYLPIPRLRTARLARERLRNFMQEQVVERKALVAAGDIRADAFTMLVKANQEESGKYPLNDDELASLAFPGFNPADTVLRSEMFSSSCSQVTKPPHTPLLRLLASWPSTMKSQKEVLDQIISVVGHDRDPTLEDYSNLKKSLRRSTKLHACFVTAGHVLIREAIEDTDLTFPNPVGEEGHRAVHIPKGTQITLDMIGAQYNPRYVDEPGTYKPSRWYGLPADSDLFTAFSVGPRACIGRKFATVQATCFLTLLLRDWQVMPILRDGETKEAWAARVLDGRIVLTLGVADCPVRLPPFTYDVNNLVAVILALTRPHAQLEVDSLAECFSLDYITVTWPNISSVFAYCKHIFDLDVCQMNAWTWESPTLHISETQPVATTTFSGSKRDRFEQAFGIVRQELLTAFAEQGVPDDAQNWYERSIDYNVPGGKLNRGLSVVETVEILKGRPLSDPEFLQAAVLGWAVEFLQAFFLVMDDLMDKSLMRRGQPCYYRVPGVGTISVNDAVLIESAIYFLLKTHFRNETYYIDLVELFHEAYCTPTTFQTATGQLLDLINAPESVDLSKLSLKKQLIARYKTAYYSFYLPVALGMLMSKIPETYESKSSGKTVHAYKLAQSILLPIGEYFQVQDDFLDFAGTPEQIGKIGTDIVDNKCSWCITTALLAASPEQRAILDASYGQQDPALEASVKAIFEEVGLREKFRVYEEEVYAEITALIEGVPEDEGIYLKRQIFTGFLEKIYKRQK